MAKRMRKDTPVYFDYKSSLIFMGRSSHAAAQGCRINNNDSSP